MRRTMVWSGLTAVLAGTLLLGVPDMARGQQGTVAGRVTDASTQQPLVGAQVFLAGTSLNSITNQDGRYLLVGVPAGQQTVRVVLIGYTLGERTVNVSAGGTATADFALDVSAVELDAVVVNAVTGLAERKREVGANVANIQVADMDMAPITNVADVIVGRAAGVTLQSTSGTMGTGQRIRIRGANSLSLSNEPLVFVDGVRVSTSTVGFGVGGQEPSRFNDIDPDDIASIEILKGPAASALYGTAAANGVVLITTKRGRAGDTDWTVYVETSSIEDVTDWPANVYPYSEVDPDAPIFTESGRFNFAARPPCYNFDAAAGNCVQDGVFTFNTLEDPRTSPFSTGFSRRAGLSASGGGERVTYYLSGDFEKGRGVVSFNEQENFNLRANLNARIRDDLRSNVTIGYVDGSLSLNNNDNSIFSPIINGLMGAPVFFPNNEDGSVNALNYGFGFTMADLANLPVRQELDRLIMGLNTTYTPLSWLTANVSVGLDLIDQHDFNTLQPNKLPIAESYAIGFRESERTNLYNYTGRGTISATFELTPSLISTTTAGASYHQSRLQSTYGFGAGIIGGTANLGASTSLFAVDEDFSQVVTLGGLVREQLAYDNRIFLGASIRGDDNSAFGTDFGFIYYPAVDLSWVIGEESWFPQTEYVNDFRMRAAYGESGQRPDFRDAITYLSPVAVQQGGDEVAAVTLGNTGNTELEPEKVREYEIGFDAGLFRNRVGVQFTYFNRESRDALIRRPLPPSLGLTGSVFMNLGAIRNQGTELAVNATVLNLEDVGFDLTFTNTTLKNEILEIGTDVRGEPLPPIILNRGEQRHQKGYPAGSFFLPELIYDDANGDGLLSRDEVTLGDSAVFIGPPFPTATRSLAADLRVFDFIHVSTLFESRNGGFQLDGTEGFRCANGFGCVGNGDPNASLAEQAAFIGDRFLGDPYGYTYPADFIKWREVSLSLSAPESLTSRFEALRGLTLTLAGRNLAVWTDYPGIDPEVNEQGAGTQFNQNEFNTQPPARYLTARVTYRF